MAELKDFVCSDDNRASVVRDTAQLVDEEVRAKGGFSGAAIKLGYKTVKAVKPGLIPNVVDGLLDNFTFTPTSYRRGVDSEKGVETSLLWFGGFRG